ncbi:MAG: sugar phosphate isomerase/epimerase [Firmicutes bacterium]|nr:sugar phosphate isomerase/epimerase [Bacillota bacterium]
MLSIFTWFGYREIDGAEALRLIKQAGFEGVLLWWDGADYRDMPALARREGLWIENMHTPFEQVHHIWEDNAAGQAVFDCYLQCVDDCAQYEIPTMIVHAHKRGIPMPADTRLGFERFRRIVDRAEQKGVNVAMENQRSPAQLILASRLLEEIASPRFGFCLDSGHHNAREEDADMLARFGHRLMALHLHDNDAADDLHLLPFDGTIDWPDQMRKIAETGYQGPTTLEVMNLGYENISPAEFLARAYERAKRLDGLRHA